MWLKLDSFESCSCSVYRNMSVLLVEDTKRISRVFYEYLNPFLYTIIYSLLILIWDGYHTLYLIESLLYLSYQENTYGFLEYMNVTVYMLDFLL